MSAGQPVRVLMDFDADADFAAWRNVDDVVMGGVSSSALRRAAAATPGIASFAGNVSLDYGGGFASVRTDPRTWETTGAVALLLRCRSTDGRTYKFTVRTDDGYDGVQYQQRFRPPQDDWSTVRLEVADFVATFRGRRVPFAGALRPERIRQLGLMVSDKQAGPFELLIDWIAAE
jgi:monofunctional biosynthetic peptidoglycan transglycosylase